MAALEKDISQLNPFSSHYLMKIVFWQRNFLAFFAPVKQGKISGTWTFLLFNTERKTEFKVAINKIKPVLKLSSFFSTKLSVLNLAMVVSLVLIKISIPKFIFQLLQAIKKKK